MISTIPLNLQAYKDRISAFIDVYTVVIEQMKSHKLDLMKFYKEINEFGMNRVISDAVLTIKSLVSLEAQISEFRQYIPLHLRFSFDKFINISKFELEREKLQYFELENRIQSLLKNMSVEIIDPNDNPETADDDYIDNDVLTEECYIDEANDTHESLHNIGVKVEELNHIFEEVAALVDESKSSVDNIEENVTKSDELMTAGTKSLISASKLKAAAIPIGTSIAGALIGGPIGLVVGLKIGVAAGLAGALCGLAGGKLIKKHRDAEIDQSEKALAKFQ